MFGHLFYSHNCDTCLNFIHLIKQENLLSRFHMILVDNLSIEQLSKLNIKIVPTLIISHNNINNMYVGKELFIWFNNLITFKRQKLPVISNNGLTSMEMSGTSDEFAYLNLDSPLPKSFMTYGHDDNDEHKIITFNNPRDSKIDSSEQHKRMLSFEKSRTEQNKFIEQQYDTLIRTTIINKKNP